MIYPTFEELSKDGKYNRYTVAMAAAKGARIVTEEYLEEREHADLLVQRKETDKPMYTLIDEELRDEKAVRTSVRISDRPIKPAGNLYNQCVTCIYCSSICSLPMAIITLTCSSARE